MSSSLGGAPGSAWSSRVELHPGGALAHEELAGTPASDDPEPLTERHLFDLASLTKVFTALAALVLVDEGLELDAPVRPHVPVGIGAGGEVTLRHLLTHTSGLPDTSLAWRSGLRGEALLEKVLASPLSAPPGQVHRYSCLGYVAAGLLLEAVTGQRLDALVGERVLRPLGSGARFAPSSSGSSEWSRWCVATEPPVRGEVHDELARFIGRPVGNAGLFGTASDVAAAGRLVLSGGVLPSGERLLRAETAALLTTPAVAADGYGQAVGLRVGEARWMGEGAAVGHTGFTGTSLLVVPGGVGDGAGGAGGVVAVLLTNRVHAGRSADVTPARLAVARAARDALRES